MKKYEIHRKVKVRNGFEITATLIDGDDIRTKHFFHQGDVEPSDEVLAPRLETMLARFIEKSKTVPEKTMLESEVEELLVKKGYLNKDEKLKDLKDKEK